MNRNYEGAWGAVVLAVCLVMSGSAAANWFVAPGGLDTNTGTPESPFATIGHAVTVAGPGDEIVLADGEYVEPGDGVVVLDGKSFTIRSASGDRDACLTRCWFKTPAGSGDFDVLLRDITLSEAGAEVIDNGWGGPWQVSTSVTVDNCVILTGLYPRASEWVVKNSRFDGCDVGLFAENISGSGPTALAVADCLFENCGVGINYSSFDIDYTVVRCVLRGNGKGITADTSSSGAGRLEMPFFSSSPFGVRDFLDCVFESNGTGAEISTYVRFLRCEFTDNGVGLSPLGDGHAIIEDCDIHHNLGDGIRQRSSAYTPSITGSRIHHNQGAGIDCENFYLGEPISDCEIYGNAGPGVRIVDPAGWSDPGGATLLTGCTVAGNGAGVVFDRAGEFDVTNTIIAFNGGEGARAARTTWNNCDIYGNDLDLEPDGFTRGLNFNIAQDPYFCDLPGGDVGLAANSPCRRRPGYVQIGARGSKCDAVLDATVVVDVVPDEAAAAWDLTGPDGFAVSGTGDSVFYQVVPGQYTITWHTVNGWQGPVPATVVRTVKPYLVKTLRGFYSPFADDNIVVAKPFGLEPNEPNPFNPSTMIRFSLDTPSRVDIVIFDLRGRRVRTLTVDQAFGAGAQALRWDGADEQGRTAAAGVYLVRLQAGRREDVLRIALVK
ncbi:hypothetical protein DRQ50_11395 [bacterium]|nr:MAG: hypothetical protein DRQ50_11395 [bacterium]